MADIQPFRAYRYDLGHVGTLSDVVAPPYDVIKAAQQQALYDRSPHNVIRLILDKELPTDTEHENRYVRAGRCLKEWINDNVLMQDSARSLYVYEQEFHSDGETYVRRGFLSRVRLEKFGEGNVYAHEETMPGPKADRLALMNATQMNLSPIFGLYPDDQNEIQQALEQAVGRALPLQASDDLGVIHRLWPISNQHVISTVTGLMGNKPVFIADGHHRYETACRYLDERRAAGEVPNEDHPANFILMMLVGMSDPGMIIQPTHRLISNVSAMSADELKSLLEPYFEVEMTATGEAGAKEIWEMIEAEGSQSVLGFGTVSDNTWQLMRCRSSSKVRELAMDHSEEWCSLAVSALHVLVLDHLIKAQRNESPQCRYVHQLDEVLQSCASGECNVAALVPAVEMDHVQLIAENLEKMPPKSTYFYPKLLSGLVLHSLKSQ